MEWVLLGYIVLAFGLMTGGEIGQHMASKERRQEVAEQWQEFLHPDDRASNAPGEKIKIIKMGDGRDIQVVAGEEGVVLGSSPYCTWARFPKEGHQPISIMLFSDVDTWETITEEKK